MPDHANIFLVPFASLEKTAEEDKGFNKIARALVSGNPDELESHLTEEDFAFFSLGDGLRTKLASGIPLDGEDIEKLSEVQIAALTVLGEDAMLKTAAYMQFFNEAAMAENQGRNIARAIIGQQKLAQQAQLEQAKKAGIKLAQDPKFRETLSKRAAAELERRKSG